MNKELLYQLYSIHSMSGNEKKMRKFLKRMAKECGASEINQDVFGNLLIVKGESDTYPCMAAHMDQVQRLHSKDFQVIEINGDAFGYSVKNHCQMGLGADDKNGIYICLEMLKRFDAIKVAFFVGEEVGCVGSSKVDLEWFSDCRFIIQPDRKGNCDLITSMYCGDVCSKDFISAIGYKDFGYKIDHGTITDVGTLVERGVGISCLNLSCGYYNAHTDKEICVLSDLENCMNFVSHIIEHCTDVYPFESGGKFYFGGYGCGYRSQSNDYDDDEYWNDGYYDEDFEYVSDLLNQLPSMDYNQLLSYYYNDFHLSYFFDKQTGESMLSEMYQDAKDDVAYSHDDFWGEDKEDNQGHQDAVGEIVSVVEINANKDSYRTSKNQ